MSVSNQNIEIIKKKLIAALHHTTLFPFNCDPTSLHYPIKLKCMSSLCVALLYHFKIVHSQSAMKSNCCIDPVVDRWRNFVAAVQCIVTVPIVMISFHCTYDHNDLVPVLAFANCCHLAFVPTDRCRQLIGYGRTVLPPVGPYLAMPTMFVRRIDCRRHLMCHRYVNQCIVIYCVGRKMVICRVSIWCCVRDFQPVQVQSCELTHLGRLGYGCC